MTTIAVRNGIVASDSRVSDEHQIDACTVEKIRHSARHPIIYAGCGHIVEWSGLIEALERRKILPWETKRRLNLPTLAESSLLAVHADGSLFMFEGDGWFRMDGPFVALGTGSDAALAAMHMGASAKKAVAIACLVDTGSGPPVRVLRTSDIRQK